MLVVLVLSAGFDIVYGKIYNLCSLSIFMVALIYNSLIFGMFGLLVTIFGLLLGLSFLLIPYILGGMGAGDVKLMGAVGAALGPSGVIVAFLYSAVAGGAYAMILMLTGQAGDFPKRLWNTLQTFYYTKQLIYDKPQNSEQQVKMCYGVAIAAGTILYIVLEMTGKGQLVQF
jgi:prepilin peptidase CpaA